MKSHVIPCTLLALVIAVPAIAQRGRGHNTIDIGDMSSSRSTRNPDGGLSLFLSGKVVLEDGTEPAESASIQTICQGQKHTETHADSHGNFTFQFGSRLNPASSIPDDADTSINSNSTLTGSFSGHIKNRTAQDCDIQALLPGFVSESVKLNAIPSNTETFNVGRIVLHRIEKVDGVTVSATTAAAPGAARKAFEKGINQEKQDKWDDAQRSFEVAVRLYEKYAVAWFELGRTQLHENDANQALHSFQSAVAADPNYVSPYQSLMQLAVKDGRWPAVAEITGKLLALNPVNFPDAWFFNSAANFLLKNFDTAEKSARQGLKMDDQHHFPRLEYILGMILLERHDYNEAALHFRQFLLNAKTPLETDEGKKQLAEAERLSASASTPAPGAK